MSCGLNKLGRRALWAAVLAVGFGGAASAGTVIINANTSYSAGANSQGSFGDLRTSNGTITGPSSPNNNPPGWKYTEINAATAGINTTYTDYSVGNGSIYFNAVNPTGANGVGKATVQYKPGGSIGGTLSQLTTLEYDWYRDSSSTVAGHLTPAIRILLQGGTWGLQSKVLVFEPVYNGVAVATTDAWVTSNALVTLASSGGQSTLWATNDPNTFKPLSHWLSEYGGWNVVGFEVGVGSGWKGTFTGGADNIRIGFNNNEATTYNFEVFGAPMPQSPSVPEPSSVAMGLIAGAAGLVMAARRRRRSA